MNDKPSGVIDSQKKSDPTRWVAGIAPLLPGAQFSDWEPWVRMGMIVLISVVLIGTGIHLITSSSQRAQNQKWGYSMITMVVGFWFGRGF